MNNDNLKNEMKTLKSLREQRDFAKEEYNALYKDFLEKTNSIKEKYVSFKSGVSGSEAIVRDIALIEFNETGEKSLDYGVGIKVKNALDYDKEAAFEWAIEHKLALLLDVKLFENIAKKDAIEFVKKISVPTATIPREIKL